MRKKQPKPESGILEGISYEGTKGTKFNLFEFFIFVKVLNFDKDLATISFFSTLYTINHSHKNKNPHKPV